MAMSIETLITLDRPEHIETWIRYFTALSKVKKSKDEKASGGENEITDLFLATAGCETVKKISTVLYPNELEELTYEENVRIITNNIPQKKKVCHWENQIYGD